jgi:hypothetical protein
MALDVVNFDMGNPQAVALRERCINLAKEAHRLSQQGFPPKRMDKYPVEIATTEEGTIVTLILKENSTEKITFDLYCIPDGEFLDILWKETFPNRMTVEEFLKSLSR